MKNTVEDINVFCQLFDRMHFDAKSGLGYAPSAHPEIIPFVKHPKVTEDKPEPKRKMPWSTKDFMKNNSDRFRRS